jgi:hypothetical protein
MTMAGAQRSPSDKGGPTPYSGVDRLPQAGRRIRSSASFPDLKTDSRHIWTRWDLSFAKTPSGREIVGFFKRFTIAPGCDRDRRLQPKYPAAQIHFVPGEFQDLIPAPPRGIRKVEPVLIGRGRTSRPQPMPRVRTVPLGSTQPAISTQSG